MNIEDLDYFLAIAEEGHVGRAASRFNVTQSAASQRLKRLETELGFPLFDRGPKGMTLTTAASAFLARARMARRGLADAVKEATDLHLGAAGVLRIGVSPFHAKAYFQQACLQLLRQRPAARLEITLDLNAPLLEALRLGQIDLSIHSLEQTSPPDLEQFALFRNDLVVIARAGHPLVSKPSLSFEDLVGQSWLLPNAKAGARLLLEARFADRGLPAPHVAIEVQTATTQLGGLVAMTDMLSVTTEKSLQTPDCQGLAALPLQDGRWRREIGIVHRRNDYLPPLASRLLEIVRGVSLETSPEQPA